MNNASDHIVATAPLGRRRLRRGAFIAIASLAIAMTAALLAPIDAPALAAPPPARAKSASPAARPPSTGKKVTYEDDMLPLLRNSCLNCHNPDKKKAGLDLSSLSGILAGSSDGKVIVPGDPDASMLYQVCTHKTDPYMPKNGDKLKDPELALIHEWIAGGALETSSSTALVSKKPKININVALAIGKPKGPIPMPSNLPLAPVDVTVRAGQLESLAASPWSPVVAIGGQKQILLYQSQTLAPLGILPFAEGVPQVLRFSRNAKLLMAGGGENAKLGKVVLYDVATGKRVAVCGNEFDTVLSADVSPDQSMVALGGPGKVLKAYSTRDNQLLYAIKKHTDWVTAVAFSPDGVLLASGDRAGGLFVWEAHGGQEFYNLAGHKDAITAVAFRSDSNLLASASNDGTIRLWSMESGQVVKSWSAHSGGVLDVAFAHDGRIVSCGRDNTIKLWSADGNFIKSFPAFGDIALHAVFSDDDKRIIGGDWTGDIRVFTVADAKPAGTLSAIPWPPAPSHPAPPTKHAAAAAPPAKRG